MEDTDHARFWRGKRVLLTGHTGFKGSWLTLWLKQLGASVTGISLMPSTTPNLYSAARIDRHCESHFCDIRDGTALERLMQATRPEIVFHLAAQPLVRASYTNPCETFETNVMGTANVLESLRRLESARVVLMVTTDKVYRHNGSALPFREGDALEGATRTALAKPAAS